MIDDKAPETKLEPAFQNAANDMTIAMKAFATGLMRGLHICFPACVYSFDRSTHIAKVMPLVKHAFYNGEWVYLRRQPFETTVRNIQAGGFTLDFPLYVGDTGWVFASDRDTQLIKREGALTNSVLANGRPISTLEDDYQQKPNTLQLNKWTFGFFLPDNWGKWENYRFKDGQGVSVADALYIGSSIDTEDEDMAGRQEGDEYEKKTTSSIVLQKAGGAYVLSSTRTKPEDAEERLRTAKVAVVGDSVNIAVNDATEETPLDASISIGTDSGITIRRDDIANKLHFIASVLDDEFMIRLCDGQLNKSVSVTFADGELDIHASDAVNVFAQKDVSIKSAGNAYVSAESARVVTNGEASVAAESVSASATKDINLAAGQSINITAPEALNLMTASNVNILAKKEGAYVSITTKSQNSSIDIKTEGDYSSVDIETQGKGANIDLTTAGEQADIDVSAVGDESSIYVSAANNLDISAVKNLNMSAEKVSISGSQVNIGGETKVNGSELKPGSVPSEGGPAWTY